MRSQAIGEEAKSDDDGLLHVFRQEVDRNCPGVSGTKACQYRYLYSSCWYGPARYHDTADRRTACWNRASSIPATLMTGTENREALFKWPQCAACLFLITPGA